MGQAQDGLTRMFAEGRRARDDAVSDRTVPERHSARHAAVSAGGGADADLRHHGPGQPGARLALHAGRLFRRDLHRADRQLPDGARARADRDADRRHGDGGDRDPPALRPRPSRPRARHLRPADLLQRAGAADLGSRGPHHLAAVGDAHRGAGAARHLLSALSAGHHRRDARGRAAALRAGDAHPHRHADPRRRLEPRDGRCARRQHQAALHAGVRPRRGARGLRRHDPGADLASCRSAWARTS